ncbi:MAG TPA: hypothetical protein VLJ68_12875 [Chitinophagaceae bacterium]|nr:hypothetical protein [Chitinophagaceae bacterium]
MRKSPFFFALFIAFVASAISPVDAQEYKMKQVNKMMGMNNESTIYVKGSRKRTEGTGFMGMGGKTVTIEQCDLQRTVKLNDNKKLYFIIPFEKDNEEIIDDDAPVKKPVTPAPVVDKNAPKKGGTIYSWYYIYDTLVRETMFGFPARHIYTWRKMKPSPDACNMKDSMEIKTDGWYIDLPEFKCPLVTKPQRPPVKGAPVEKPDCMDKFVSHKKGKGKLGYPLKETTTMIMGGQASTFETGIEVVEFTKMKLDSMLFEIPPGYKEAANEGELTEQLSMADMIKNAQNQNNNNANGNNNNVTIQNNIANNNVNNGAKQPGMIRIGVFEPKGEGGFTASELQKNMALTLTTGNIEGIVITSAEDAKAKNCDYTLSSDISKFKSASKLGGLIKAIKNADPNAASTFNIEANLTLVLLSDGSVKTNPKVDGKYEGKTDDAALKAMNDGCGKVLKALQ